MFFPGSVHGTLFILICTLAGWEKRATQDVSLTTDDGFDEDFFPKQCGHTEGVLTVRVKGPVFNRGGQSCVRHFFL